jgi:hypothetical protein
MKSQTKTTARDATRCLGYIFRYAVLCYMLHTCSILYTSLLYPRHLFQIKKLLSVIASSGALSAQM